MYTQKFQRDEIKMGLSEMASQMLKNKVGSSKMGNGLFLIKHIVPDCR